MSRTTVLTYLKVGTANKKTGRMAVVYRPRTTCPASCPFRTGGCYAAGRIEAIARFGCEGDAWVDQAVREVPVGGMLRQVVVGDLLGADGRLDGVYVRGMLRLARLRADVRQGGYTHAHAMASVAAAVRRLGRAGVVINASCESAAQAATASLAGMLPVMVLTGADDPAIGSTIDGRRVIVCPAQTRDGVQCVRCGLCWRSDTAGWRRPVIGFLPHGGGMRKAVAAVVAAR